MSLFSRPQNASIGVDVSTNKMTIAWLMPADNESYSATARCLTKSFSGQLAHARQELANLAIELSDTTGLHITRANFAIDPEHARVEKLALPMHIPEYQHYGYLRYAMEDAIGLPEKQMCMDYRIIEKDLEAEEYLALVVACRREAIAELQELACWIGITPSAIEIKSIAIARAIKFFCPEFNEQDLNCTAMLEMGKESFFCYRFSHLGIDTHPYQAAISEYSSPLDHLNHCLRSGHVHHELPEITTVLVSTLSESLDQIVNNLQKRSIATQTIAIGKGQSDIVMPNQSAGISMHQLPSLGLALRGSQC